MLTANELKIRGIAAIEAALETVDEVILSVRGKPRYVVLDLDRYELLQEAAVYAAWHEARAAETRGDYLAESAEAHIARLERDRQADDL